MVTRHTLQRISRGIEAVAMQALGGRPVRIVWAGCPSGPAGESAEMATERYLAEHPEARGYGLMVVSWLPAGSADRPRPEGKAATSEVGGSSEVRPS